MIKRGSLVKINDGKQYYNLGIIDRVIKEDYYIFTFNEDGNLSEYNTRYPKSQLRKTSLSEIMNILQDNYSVKLKENINCLRKEGKIEQ